MEQKVDEGRATRLRIAVATWGRFVAWREQGHGGGAVLEYALVLAFVVAVVMGSPRNIKITTPADLELAEFYLQQQSRHRAAG